MKMTSRDRSGTTLVEILIASIVVTVLLMAVFKIYKGGSGLLKAGMWASKAQSECRNALTMIRDEMAKATVFTTISETGPQPSTDAKYQVKIKTPKADKDYNGPIIRFYHCRTAIKIPGTNDDGGKVVCEVVKQGRKLIYSKVVEDGTTEDQTFSGRVLVDDVVEVAMSTTDAATTDQLVKKMVTILITLEDPAQEGRRVVEETKAQVETEVGNL